MSNSGVGWRGFDTAPENVEEFGRLGFLEPLPHRVFDHLAQKSEWRFQTSNE